MNLAELFKAKSNIYKAEAVYTEAVQNADAISKAKEVSEIVSKNVQRGDFSSIKNELKQFQTNDDVTGEFVFALTDTKRYKFFIILSAIFLLIFSYYMYIAFTAMSLSSNMPDVKLLFGLTLLAVFINVIVIIKYSRRNLFSKRFSKLYELLKHRRIILTDDLCYYSGIPEKSIITTLKKAIKLKLIPQGHFTKDGLALIVSDELFIDYIDNQLQFEQYIRNELLERERVAERSDEIEAVLNAGQEHIETIREYNRKIADKEMTRKLTDIENLVSNIFLELDMHPNQLNRLKTFLNYFLPTTEKLLEAYVQIDNNFIKSRRMASTKKEIEESLNAIIVAFGNLLDKFYEEERLDLTTDIETMEIMMKR